MHTETGNPDRGPQGFTLVELMIGVVIVGVLASIAIPTFKRYKDKAKFAESYSSLGAMTVGAKAYYEAEHWRRGLVTAGYVGPAGYCTVGIAWSTNQPGLRKTTMDWTQESPSFAAISFGPADPIYFAYYVGLPGFSAGACGHPPNSGTALLYLAAFGDFDDSVGNWHGQQWHLCSNDDNSLYTCARHDSPTIEYMP